MRLSRRSYPHPVVGNLDDVPGAAFQATTEMSLDQDNAYIDANIQCSSATISGLVAEGSAAYAVHVECTNTIFRRAFEFAETVKRIAIPLSQLNDTVEVNVFAVARRDRAGYIVEKSHSDYANSTFEIRKGDILAVGEGKTFTIESRFDALNRIGSIMLIEAAPDDGDRPMRIDFNGDKIRVILSKADFASYKLLRHNEDLSGILTTTIVLPALLETLYYVETSNDDEELEPLKWYRALRRRIEALNLGSENEKLIKAQKLLELPVKRTLATAQVVAEAAS
jgi:hypothetical protein